MAVGLLLHHPTSPLFVPTDGLYYLDWAQRIRSDLMGMKADEYGFPIPGTLDRKIFFPLILAALGLIGDPVILGILFNSIICAITIQLVSNIVREEKWCKRPELVTFLLYFGNPVFMVFGPSLLREAPFWLGAHLTAISIWKAFRRESSTPWLIPLTVGISIMFSFRPDLGLGIGLVATIAIVIPILRLGASDRTKVISTLIAMFATMALLLWLTYRLPSLDYLTGIQIENSNAATTAVPTETIEANSPLLIWLANIPNTFFGPFPFQLPLSITSVWVVFAQIRWLITIAFSLFALKVTASRPQTGALLVIALAALVAVAAFYPNYGAITRFRVISEFLLFPCFFIGLRNLIFDFKGWRSRKST